MTGRPLPCSWQRGRCLCAAISALLSATPVWANTVSSIPRPVVATAAEVVELQLEVFINEYPSGWIVPFRHTPDGRFLVEPDELHTLGLNPAEQAQGEDGWIDLSLLPGVHARYDEPAQALHLTAGDAALMMQFIDARYRGRDARADHVSPSPRDIGAYLNHMLSYDTGGAGGTGWRRFQGISGVLDGHVYSPAGVVSSAHTLSRTRSGSRAVRLDTQWAYFDQERLITYSAGDVLSASLPWTRSARLGGVQIRRNFAIRPDLITMPLMNDLSGSAAVPSTVEVYINNVQRLSREIGQGPFAITDLPLITGGGTARLVVRDALGRETISETSFYAASNLLARGLMDFSLDAGVARHHYGQRSQGYDNRPLGVGTVRYGVNNAFTVEGHAETGAHFYQAGLGGVLRLGTLGVANFSAAGSDWQRPVRAPGHGAGGRHERGQQWTLGVQTQWRGFNLYANTRRSYGLFNDIASISLPDDAWSNASARANARPPWQMSQVSLSLPPRAGLSMNLSYTPMRQFSGTRTRLASASARLRLGRHGSLALSLFRDLARADSFSAFLGYVFFFDNRVTGSSSLDYSQRHTTTRFSLGKSVTDQFGSTGWQLRAARGRREMLGMEVRHRTRYGTLDARAERFSQSGGHSINTRMQFEGALVWAGGGLFAANRIHNAFAIVNVGAADVPVKHENRLVGRSNARGQLLLTGLRAFEHNLISIDPLGLPPDARADVTRLTASPGWQSGMVVDFKVNPAPRSALLSLHDDTGALIPVGAGVRLNGGAEVFVVGHDGQVYLPEIAGRNQLRVMRAGAPDCIFEFDAPDKTGGRVVMADAVCRGIP